MASKAPTKAPAAAPSADDTEKTMAETRLTLTPISTAAGRFCATARIDLPVLVRLISSATTPISVKAVRITSRRSSATATPPTLKTPRYGVWITTWSAPKASRLMPSTIIVRPSAMMKALMCGASRTGR